VIESFFINTTNLFRIAFHNINFFVPIRTNLSNRSRILAHRCTDEGSDYLYYNNHRVEFTMWCDAQTLKRISCYDCHYDEKNYYY